MNLLKFSVRNRFSGSVQFTAEIECGEDAADRIKLGLAVRWGFKTGADLRGADLRGAYLGGADLRGAYLRGADLRGAYLRGAYLGGADLGGADLRGAYLRGAYLGGADLGGADLGGADLGGADLGGAYLGGADLRGADLRGADLGGADLGGAKLTDDITINLAPVFVDNLKPYAVSIYDEHMKIGCEFHKLADWEAFDDRRILAMGGKEALAFWRGHKDVLLGLAKAAGRSWVAAPAAVSEEQAA